MNQNQTSLLEQFGTPIERVENALEALRQGRGILLLDDEDRENEGDLIYSTDHLTNEQMALMIRECSGIVCLCVSDEHANQLELPPMVEANDSKNQTAFTVSIEAKEGVTTGVSAADRVTTIKTAARLDAKASDLARPGTFSITCTSRWCYDSSRSYRRYNRSDANGGAFPFWNFV